MLFPAAWTREDTYITNTENNGYYGNGYINWPQQQYDNYRTGY